VQQHNHSTWLLLLLLLLLLDKSATNIAAAAAAAVACRPSVACVLHPSLVLVCLKAPFWTQPFLLRLCGKCWTPVPGMNEVFWVQCQACKCCCTLQPGGTANFVKNLQQTCKNGRNI
jgi:hypothetical protein